MTEVGIYEVEHPDGALLFAAADPSPVAAEDLLRTAANIPTERYVLIYQPDA